MAIEDFDIVGDIANGDVVSAHKGTVDSTVGSEPAVSVNEQASVKQATKIDRTDTQQRPEDKRTSLRDQISSALKGEQATPPAATADGGAARNPDGTFAPKVTPAPGPAGDPAAANVQPAVVPPLAAAAAPLGLTPQEAQVFAQLPAELQTIVARTMESVREKEARLSGFEQLIAPRREAWALNGVTEVQAVNQLLALSDFASRDPSAFIQYFAQQRNVDLEELVLGTEPVDPSIAALQTEVQQLRGQLTGMTTQQQQQAHEATVNEIVTFASEAGTDGSPLRPYFEELGDSILPFIQAALQQNPNAPRQQVLQDAYDRACWGTPSVRAKMQAAADAAREAQRIREQQEATARAKRAGSSIPTGVPTSPAPSAASGTSSIRDTIRASIASAT